MSCASLQGMLVVCLCTPLVYIFFLPVWCMFCSVFYCVLLFCVMCETYVHVLFKYDFNALFLQILLHIVTLLSHKSSQTRIAPNFCKWSCQYCTNNYNKNKRILTVLKQFTCTLISSMYFHFTVWFYKSTMKLCFV